MEVRKLIQEFKDKNDIMNHELVTGMVAYGSRVNHFESDISDLDILLVTSGKDCYKGGQLIEGVKIEMGIYAIDKLLSLIYEDKINNNRFFSSVFNTGLVEKNVDHVVDSLKEFVNTRYMGGMEKRKMHPEVKKELQKLYMHLVTSKDGIYEDFYYYNLIELIRNSYIYINNCSRLAFTKVYDVYQNNLFMNTYYQLKMPPNNFLSTFLIALSTNGYYNRKKIIDELLRMIGIEPFYIPTYRDSFKITDINDFDDLEYKIIFLREKIKKVEDMLLTNHTSKMYVYHITLNRLKDLITLINNGDFEEAEEDFEWANSCETDNERIDALEKLFEHIDKKFNLDYDNYLVKRY